MRKTSGFVLAVVLAMPYPVQPQTTFATITGIVTDSSGSIIPNAKVTATEVNTGISTATVSNASGDYTIAQLKDGAYRVTAQMAGVQESIISDVILAARDIRRIDIRLEVGSVDTKLEVKAGATLIETETARISNTKDSLVLNSVPLNTRALWAFLALSPGLNAQPDGVVRFAGSRVNQNNWTIDGTTFADGVDNTA